MVFDYGRLHTFIREYGRATPSRYGPCYELVGERLSFVAGATVTRRGFSMPLAVMELWQILAGTFDLDAIKAVAPHARHELFTEAGAYGPRLRNQIPAIISLLQRDPDSRQAVLYVAGPPDVGAADMPCTETIQFLLRGGQLLTVVSMRSWDATMGLPVDVVCFGGLAQAVAGCLGAIATDVSVTAGSLHMYVDYPDRWREGCGAGPDFQLDLPSNWGAVQRRALYGYREIATRLPPQFILIREIDAIG